MTKGINPFSGVLRALLCVAAISVSTVTAAAQLPTFTTQNNQLLGNTHIASDFNGDGTFRPKVDYPVAGPTQNVAVGDFNSDGKLDLVVTINTPEISLALLTGNGTFDGHWRGILRDHADNLNLTPSGLIYSAGSY